MAQLLVRRRQPSEGRVRRHPMEAAVLVLALGSGSSGCGGDAPAANEAVRTMVVASVDGDAVTAAEVAALLPEEEPVRIGAKPPPDPMGEALQTAVRHRLLAREAQHRGLVPARSESLVSLDAQRVQALLAQERTRHGLTVAAITDAEARRAYEQRRHEFDEIDRVEVLWVVVDDERRAEQLLAADGGSEAGFRRLAAAGSDALHHAEIDSKGNGADLVVARVALALRTAGRVGMAPAHGGGYYVVRATAVHFESRPWDPSLSMLVRTALAWEMERDHMEALGEELWARWPVRIHEDRLHEISETWEQDRTARHGTEAPRSS